MASIQGPASGGAGGRSLVIFSMLAIAASLFAVHSASQQPSQAAPPPPTPPPPPPPPVSFANPIPPAQLAFLAGFDGHSAKELMKDKRFRQLMNNEIPHTVYHYGHDLPLEDALKEAIDGAVDPVQIRQQRYLLASGRQGPYLAGRGLIWIDLQQGIFLGGFYFHPTNGEPTPTLTIFSRQLGERELAMSQLPPEFAADLSQWSLIEHVPEISPRYFIPDNGKKYVLIHDEAYCTAPPGEPEPNADTCAHLDEQAADADMNAAYFMQETHNAANATAWMLGPDQVAWIQMRESTCGLRVQCRVAFTRQRTRAILGHSGPSAPGRR
jgi:Lysozyme inhibitor LprI